jgi:hypothetical protein
MPAVSNFDYHTEYSALEVYLENWEQKMEEEWGPVFVHESGHALMAVLHKIPCHGICFERGGDAGQFCAVIPPVSPKHRSKPDYLVLAAGVAAERLIYPHKQSMGANADRRDFESSGSHSEFDATVQEAYEIISSERRKLKRLVSMLKSKTRAVDFDLGELPEVGMDGSDRRYLILLSKDELENAVNRA